MAKVNKKVFTVYRDASGKTYENPTDGAEPFELAVLRPNQKVQKAAQLHVNRIFRELYLGGTILKAQVEAGLKERNLISEENEEKIQKIEREINENELKLEKGGIRKSEGKSVAFNLIKLRQKENELRSNRNLLDQNTAEGQAENERFSYLVSECTVDNNTGNKYFKSYDEYITKEDDVVPVIAARNLVELVFDPIEMQKQLPEWKFLTKYGFADEKLRLVNEHGEFVDMDGRRVDEFGRYLDKDGNYVDIYGNKLDKDGNFAVEFSEFLED